MCVGTSYLDAMVVVEVEIVFVTMLLSVMVQMVVHCSAVVEMVVVEDDLVLVTMLCVGLLWCSWWCSGGV